MIMRGEYSENFKEVGMTLAIQLFVLLRRRIPTKEILFTLIAVPSASVLPWALPSQPVKTCCYTGFGNQKEVR